MFGVSIYLLHGEIDLAGTLRHCVKLIYNLLAALGEGRGHSLFINRVGWSLVCRVSDRETITQLSLEIKKVQHI